MKESLFSKNQEIIKAVSDYYSKEYSQDDSGLFLRGADVSDASDMSDPISEVNTDPRFKIRIQNIG